MKARAALFHGARRLELVDHEISEAPGALIRVTACGVCGTDRRVWKNWSSRISGPRVIGHETAGVVVSSTVPGIVAEGDRVVLAPPAVPCRACGPCRRGMSNLCENRISFGFELDGGFAEYVHAPADVLERRRPVPIPAAVSDEHAALAEPLGCVINGAEALGAREGEWVLVLGAGFIGRSLARLAQLAGATVIIGDVDERRLAECEGIEHRVNSGAATVAEEVMDLAGGPVDAVIVATSAAAAHDTAASVAGAGGGTRVLLFAGLPGESSAWQPNLIHYRELQVYGAFSARRPHIERALQLLAEGELGVERMVERRRLDELEAVLETDPGEQARPKVVISA